MEVLLEGICACQNCLTRAYRIRCLDHLTLSDEQLVFGARGIRQDVIRLDYRSSLACCDSGIIGGLRRITRWRGQHTGRTCISDRSSGVI